MHRCVRKWVWQGTKCCDCLKDTELSNLGVFVMAKGSLFVYSSVSMLQAPPNNRNWGELWQKFISYINGPEKSMEIRNHKKTTLNVHLLGTYM